MWRVAVEDAVWWLTAEGWWWSEAAWYAWFAPSEEGRWSRRSSGVEYVKETKEVLQLTDW